MGELETSIDRIEKSINEIDRIIKQHSSLDVTRQTQTVFMIYEEGHRLTRNMDIIKREVIYWREKFPNWQGENGNE